MADVIATEADVVAYHNCVLADVIAKIVADVITTTLIVLADGILELKLK